jgi:S-adenosylmethionine/arginine decarboxylase-like enzyme
VSENVFGWELLLDLYECDPEKLTSREAIADFAVRVCDLLEMRRFGDPVIEHFGYEKPETVGYSLVQLIETSSIVGHFSEFKRSAYIDVFSCRPYDPDAVVRFTQGFFGAQRVVKRFIERI